MNNHTTDQFWHLEEELELALDIIDLERPTFLCGEWKFPNGYTNPLNIEAWSKMPLLQCGSPWQHKPQL